jgi:hypothetical protein
MGQQTFSTKSRSTGRIADDALPLVNVNAQILDLHLASNFVSAPAHFACLDSNLAADFWRLLSCRRDATRCMHTYKFPDRFPGLDS